MRPLPPELIPQQIPPLLRQRPVPARCHRDACRKNGRIVSLPDSQRAVLETQPLEAQPRDGADVADAGTGRARYESNFFLERELGDEVGGAREGGVPVEAGGVGWEGVSAGT